MSDHIEKILENPNSLLEWVEPWLGIDEAGEEYDIPVSSRMSVRDAIGFMRYLRTKEPARDGRKESDHDLLEEFMVVHWAQEVSGD